LVTKIHFIQNLNDQQKYKSSTEEGQSLYEQANQFVKDVQLFQEAQKKIMEQEIFLIELVVNVQVVNVSRKADK